MHRFCFPALVLAAICSTALADDTQIVRAVNAIESTPLQKTPTAPGQAYWSQFGENHVTEYPVPDWLYRSQSYTLIERVVNGQKISLAWNSEVSAVEMTADGTPVTDLIMGQDTAGRPTFAAQFQDGVPQLSGVLDADESSGAIVLQLELASADSMRALIQIDEQAASALVAATSTCVCFGAPGGGRACSTTECDTGDSCGTATNGTNKACRWKSGSVAVAL